MCPVMMRNASARTSKASMLLNSIVTPIGGKCAPLACELCRVRLDGGMVGGLCVNATNLSAAGFLVALALGCLSLGWGLGGHRYIGVGGRKVATIGFPLASKHPGYSLASSAKLRLMSACCFNN